MEKQVLVITGGSSGFGEATVRKFNQQGEAVVAVGRNTDKLKALNEELGMDYFSADVSKPEDWEALRKYVTEKYGRIDLLLNNAGTGVAIEDVVDQTIANINTSIDVNLKGAIYGSRVFAPMMISQKSGTIINISSVCAQHAWPGFAVYAAAKWGVVGFSKGLHVELRPHNIRVSCLVPAAADTNFGINAGRGKADVLMKADDFAQVIVDVFNLPKHIVIEEATVWGIDQEVVPF